MREPNINDLRNPIDLLSLGFGSGLLKPAPGTWGTLASIAPWLLLAQLSTIPYLAIVLLSLVLGVYFCDKTSARLGVHDHSAIVWDEFVGMWITLFLVPISVLGIPYLGVVIAFIWFRLFDIVKPWPIKIIDNKVHSGLGIMMDDVIAGVFACLATHGTIYLLLNIYS